jgi:hypothetical protein
MTTEQAITPIETARQPCDLFGREPGRSYRRLARLTHPETSGDDVSPLLYWRGSYLSIGEEKERSTYDLADEEAVTG